MATLRSDPRSRRTTVGRASARHLSRGLTLIEILVVLSIMAIGAAFVVPMVSGQGATTGELKSAARQIAAGLRLARSEAVAARRETTLTLDLEARSFHVANDAREIALPAKVDLKLFTAQSDLVSGKRGAIRFFPDGGSNGGRVTVSSGERKYEVDVDWLTGRVAILD
ncbi:MAG TPA: GspH/FimT family pseudopilin [Casimicrobiaceae bacterium]|nr:GspH/FimT family pseudopilin [Casimicrobiaceae bacterium]